MMIAENAEERAEDMAPSHRISSNGSTRSATRGYEMMASAQTAGVFNLSAPVLGPDGKAIAALTCPYITLVNLPDAPDIDDARKMLVATTAEAVAARRRRRACHSSVNARFP